MSKRDTLNLSTGSDSDAASDEDSLSQPGTPRGERALDIDLRDEEQQAKGADYVDKNEGSNNFYKDRIKMENVSRLIDPTEQFAFANVFPLVPEKYPYRGKDIINMIDDGVENFKKEPTKGLHLSSFDENAFNQTRKDPRKIPYHNYVPSKFGPQLPPLKRFEYFSKPETVSSIQELFSLGPENISLISLQNFAVDVNPKTLCDKINKFYKTQVLVLRNLRVSSLVGCKLPLLRVCDLKTNLIMTTSQLIPFLEHSPHLEHLSVLENKLMNEPKWKEKILCHSLKLKSLNGAPVSFQEKHIAVQAVGSPQQKKQFYLLKWDWTINQIVERLQFQDWDPTRITKLSLANAELHEIHVGGLVMLKELDVSSNSLTTIVGAGLERLDFLHDFNFSHNMISDLDCLSVLGYLPEIKTVRAHDNPLSQNEYRKRIIFYTCNMKGTNRCPGLVTLDGIPITIDQRIEAQQFYQDFTADQTNILRWNYAIINLYGHHQIRKVPDFIKRVRKMTMSNCNLSYVDLRSFTSLQFVDLSKNNITKVDGLLSLRRLRYLDLSSNPNLPKEDVISQLSRLKKLRHVLLAPDLTKAKKDVGRAQVLLKLVKNNQYLFALDDILISPSERQDLAKSLINSRYELDRYYFHLAIVNQIVPFLERSYNDEGILPGKIYEPEEVTMLRFANLQLPQGSFAFNRFTSITRLDLSGNKIVSIVDIGLQSCRAIEILDFSRNDVDNKVHQIADLLNCFPELEVLAMAENPVCQKKSGYRMSILKKLNTMKGLVVKLKILDQEVTPADRKEVWAYHKLDDKHKEELRFKETMEQSGYLKQNPLTIEKIHLNQCALQMVDLTAFSNVRYLLLRGNRLVSLVGTGVLEMKKLKCVDLRNNMLKNIEEIYQLIENNPDLETIGLKLKQIGANTEIKIKEENFAKLKGDEHRDLVIKHAPRLRQVYSPLWEIDDQEITIDEIAKNWPYATSIEDTEKEVTKFRFEAILFRKYVSSFKLSTALSTITVNRLQIQALDLSGQKLTAVDFTGFANLKKLRLKNNLLDDKALMASGLINTSVAELDLRENRIVQLDTVVQFIDQCQNHLKMLFIENNPCYTSKHPPKSKGYKQQRQKLLHLLNSTQVPTWSMILNGDKVTVVERCRAMEQSMKPAEVEVLRTAITLAEKGYAGAEKVVDVSHRYLTNIQILSTYTQLIRLELAKNRLTDIDLNFFKNLPKLHYLDIRNNEIPREKLLLSVGASASLRELYIHKAGPEFNEAPVIYANSVFKMMRMLEVVDGINNPIQLSYDQKLALRYLAKFDVSPNNVQEIEITKEVTKAQFWCIVLAFQTLQGTVDKEAVGVRSIKIANSSQLDDYRFMLINHIDTLTVIDGQPVPEAEFNALIVTLDHMRKRLESKKEQPVQLPTQISLRMLRRSIMQHQKLLIDQGERAPARVPTPSGVKPPLHQHTSSIAIELRETDLGEGRNSIYSTNPVNEESVQLDHGSNLFDINSHKQATNINEEDIDFTYIERNFNSIPLINSYQYVLEQRNKYSTYSGILDNFEIIVYYIQLFGLIQTCNIAWPSTFQAIVKYATISDISLEVVTPLGIPTNIYYAKFSLIMTLPLLFLFLFLIPLKKSHWEYLLVPTWKLILSLFGILILWLFSYVIAFLFGFVAYRDSFIEVATGQLPTMDVFYIAIIFGVVVTVLFIAWIGTIITFRIKSQDDAFWYHYFIKYRQRIMLFFVTIMYFPVLREIGVTFQCEPYVGYRSTLGVKSLLFYTDQVCPENIAQGPPMYYIASAFAAFYCIIVPIAMIIMIAVDSKQATKLYGIDSAWKEYNEAKKLFNKQKKEYEKEQRKKYQEQLAARYEDIVERYTDSVKHHSSASSTLYVGFKSWTRFYRIFQLFVRVFLVSIIVFMYNEDMKTSQGPIIGGMLVVYGLLTVIIRPYVDPLHTVADVLTHAVLVATVFIGYAGDAIPELVSSIILYVINGLNLIAVVGIIFVHPIRKRINKRADEQKTKNKLGQLRLTQQEVSYCHYTLATDEQPHEAMQEMMNQDDDGAYAIDAVPTFDLQQDKSIVQSEEINVIVSPPSP